MPRRIPGVMEKYEFSETEAPSAMVFTDMQLMHLQTELAVGMQNKFNISGEEEAFDKPERFVRAHEYWRGYCEAIQALINVSDDLLQSEIARLKVAAASAS